VKKVNGQYYIQNPQFFPWGALKLDPPLYGPVHVAMLKIISIFQPHQKYKTLTTATPTEISKIDDYRLKQLLERASAWADTHAYKDEYAVRSLDKVFNDFETLLSEHLTDLARRGIFSCTPDLWI
jgi:hypothetical protein